MSLFQRYKKLSLWNKLGAWGSVASIVGLALYIGFQVAPADKVESDKTNSISSYEAGKHNSVNLKGSAVSPIVQDSENVSINQTFNSSIEVNKEASLELTMRRQRSSYGYEFTLSNSNQRLVIVESIGLEVLDVMEDKYPSLGAVLSFFEYTVEISPDFRGTRIFAQDFRYAAGDADLFSVSLQREMGYDYIFRFVVKWYDPQDKESRSLYSEILVNYYPDSKVGIMCEFAPEEWREEAKAHHKRVKMRVAELENQLDINK